MEGFAIIKIEADAVALKENIVAQFNEYLHRTSCGSAASFVESKSGYFQMAYGGNEGASSVGIAAIGGFLQSNGNLVSQIRAASTENNGCATEISFTTGNGLLGKLWVSTERVY